jgi:hypothetical protein
VDHHRVPGERLRRRERQIDVDELTQRRRLIDLHEQPVKADVHGDAGEVPLPDLDGDGEIDRAALVFAALVHAFLGQFDRSADGAPGRGGLGL